MNNKLPSWAEWIDKKAKSIAVNIDAAYPKYLEELALKPTQYHCGVVKECICRDLVNTQGEGLLIRFRGDKTKWSDAVLPGKEGDHEKGMKSAHKFRARLLEARAARAGLE